MAPPTLTAKYIRISCDLFLGLFLLFGIASFVSGLSILDTNFQWGRTVLLISGFFIIGAGLLFYLGVETRIKVSMVLLSTLISLFICNLYLEYSLPTARDLAIKAAAAMGVEWDRREKLEVVTELRERGHEAYPLAYPYTILHDYLDQGNTDALHKLLPLGGISNVTTVACNETGRYLIHDSDRYGFRNDDTAYANRDHRVLLIGDSFAYGECVQPGEDVAGRLRERGYNVITIGMGGSGPLLELAALEEYGRQLKPEIVLWMYVEGNDLHDLRYEYTVPILRQYLEQDFSQGLVHRQVEIDEFWKKTVQQREKEREKQEQSREYLSLSTRATKLITLSNIRFVLGLSHHHFLEEEAPSRFGPILEKAKRRTASLGGKLYLVYLPGYQSFVRSPPPSRAQIMLLAEQLKIPVADFYAFLRDHGDPLNFYPQNHGFRYGHYTVEGYELLAELIEQDVLNPVLRLED